MKFLGVKAADEDLATQEDLGGGAVFFVGTATASQNVHGASGTEANITWDTTINDTDHVDGHSDGDSLIVAKVAEDWLLDASVVLNNVGVNNRTTYYMRITHMNSADTELFNMFVDDTYVRDDANDYDSGMMGVQGMKFIMAAGDKLEVSTYVQDVQTTTGSVTPSSGQSKIRIQSA